MLTQQISSRSSATGSIFPEFKSMRIAAKATTRKAAGGEVTYKQIYDYVPLGLELKDQRTLELDLERTLVAPVTAVLSQVQLGI